MRPYPLDLLNERLEDLAGLGIQRDEARVAMRSLSVVAAVIGAASVLAAGPIARLAGMMSGPRSLLAIRLFGVRDLCLAYGLHRAAEEDDPATAILMADLVALAQVGDLVVTTAMLLNGSVSWRAAAAVWLGAPSTLATAVAIRAGYTPKAP